MKRSLLALAVLGAFAGAASAQSSVTLFGVLDVNAQGIKNNTTTQRLSTDGIASSRIGFRGVEDLGGGLRASFHLEGALSPDVGSAGGSNSLTNSSGTSALFNRRATVSLLGGFGEVRLGRDYDPTFWNITNFDPFGTNGVGSSLNVLSTIGSGVGTLVRANNSIGYFLPGNLGGLYGQAMVAAGEGAESTGVTTNNTTDTTTTTGAGNKYYGGRVGYAAGPFDVAVAYATTEAFNGQKYKLGNAAGSWDFGVAKIMAQYINAKFNAPIGERKQVNYLLGAVVPVGAGEFHASYDRANQSGAGTGSNDANLMALGYVYNLSKRTALYGTVARINNKGAQNFSVNGANTGTSLLTGGRDSTGYEVGVRHSF